MATGNFTVKRAKDCTATVTFTDEDGVAVNITGYTVYFTVKRNINDTDAEALISKTITSHTTPISGITTLTLSQTDTDLVPRNYVYDLQLKDTSNKESASDAGKFIVEQPVRAS